MTGVVDFTGVGVQPFDHPSAHARLVAEPDRRADHQYVGALDPRVDLGPVVTIEAELGHVWLHARGEIVIDGTDLVDVDAVLAHDRRADGHQARGVRNLGRPLERAVDVDGAEV
jgi:hypothetical protein